jgi:hypothetical protein
MRDLHPRRVFSVTRRDQPGLSHVGSRNCSLEEQEMATGAQTQRSYDQPLVGTGWVSFAGTMLILVGFFNVINGIAAIANSDYLVNRLLFANLDAWGWFFLVWGVFQVLTGFAILGGATWAAIVGVFMAFVNAIAQLSWARANPIWAICAMVLDALVIYGLIVYGGQRDEI